MAEAIFATELQIETFRAADTDTAGSTRQLIAAPASGSGLVLAVLTLNVTNTSSTASLVTIKSATNAIAYFSVKQDENVARSWPIQAPLWCNAEEALQWTTDAALSTLYIDIQGLIIPVPELVTA